MKHMRIIYLALCLLAACSLLQTSDTSSDAASADRFVPQSIPGYTVTDAASVTEALANAGVAATVFKGNPALAAVISRLDGMVQCYKGVGAVSAKIYTETNASTSIIPKVGVLAVVNTTRLQRDFLYCALAQNNNSIQAEGAIQPCSGSGSKVVNNETLEYVYGATTPELCSVFEQQFK